MTPPPPRAYPSLACECRQCVTRAYDLTDKTSASDGNTECPLRRNGAADLIRKIAILILVCSTLLTATAGWANISYRRSGWGKAWESFPGLQACVWSQWDRVILEVGWPAELLDSAGRDWGTDLWFCCFEFCSRAPNSISIHGLHSDRKVIVRFALWRTSVVLAFLWVGVLFVSPRWRRRQRHRRGLCTGCGYDLTGNESGKCPECGAPIEVKAGAR